jgi:hypothetical protein
VAVAFQEVQSSFDRFCLIAGIEALQELLREEASALCGERHQRHDGRRGRRWGETRSQVAFHGGRVGVDRPRVRSREGTRELVLPSWAAAQDEDLLGQWAMNQMLSRPGNSAARCDFRPATSGRFRATAPRSRR